MTEQCQGEGPPRVGDRREWDFAQENATERMRELEAQGWRFIRSKAHIVRLDASTTARRIAATMEYVGHE